MTDAGWPVETSVTEYETGWYDGGYDLVEQPDGSEKRYYWADLPAAVIVVAVDGADVVLVEQYRPTVRERHLELPAGIVENGETYIGAAVRELEEEVGLVPGETELIQTLSVATGVLRHERGFVVARDLEPGERSLDDNEFLTIRRLPREDAIDKAREPPANDATIEGLLLAAGDGYL
jgi:ADP-ribose pyrophosphatase